MSSSPLRNAMLAILGVLIGGGFLWLALRDVSSSELKAQARGMDYAMVAFACATYWCAIGLRIFRWQAFLRQLGPAPLRGVCETLIVGYAVNNVLPARLGEFARAAYANRRLGIGPTEVFGSIIIERVLDLVAILLCLAGGLALWHFAGDTQRLSEFESVALHACWIILAVIAAVFALRHGFAVERHLPGPVVTIIENLRLGLGSLNRTSAALGAVLTIAVWAFEIAALALVFAALGVNLSAAQAMLLMGASTLSTLVPTAPGYLGTYQFVAVVAMTAFGYGDAVGFAAATTVQLVLFGSVSVVGGILLTVRGVRRLTRDYTQSRNLTVTKVLIS